MLHLLRAPQTTTEQEAAQLAALDRFERRYLKGRCCALCDQGLDRVGCGSLFEACEEEQRIKRREACLREYKPRYGRRQQSNG